MILIPGYFRQRCRTSATVPDVLPERTEPRLATMSKLCWWANFALKSFGISAMFISRCLACAMPHAPSGFFGKRGRGTCAMSFHRIDFLRRTTTSQDRHRQLRREVRRLVVLRSLHRLAYHGRASGIRGRIRTREIS